MSNETASAYFFSLLLFYSSVRQITGDEAFYLSKAVAINVSNLRTSMPLFKLIFRCPALVQSSTSALISKSLHEFSVDHIFIEV